MSTQGTTDSAPPQTANPLRGAARHLVETKRLIIAARSNALDSASRRTLDVLERVLDHALVVLEKLEGEAR